MVQYNAYNFLLLFHTMALSFIIPTYSQIGLLVENREMYIFHMYSTLP